MMSHIQTKINDLRLESLQKVLESILAVLGALFTILLLPQLLVRYVYADQQLTAEPKAIELIPVIAFAIALLYIIYTIAGNISRANKIKLLQSELDAMYSDDEMNMDEAELAELEAIVEDALQEDDTASMAAAMKPSKSKKSSKKSKK